MVGGLVSGGELLRGASGYGGEVGHMVVNPNGRQCACGGAGCWQTEVGDHALLARAGLNPSGGRGEVDLLIKRASTGDPRACEAFAEAGRWLALGLTNVAMILNPQILVLGGTYQRGFAFVENAILKELRQRPLAPVRKLKVVPSALGADASLIGASELAFDRVLTDPIGLSAGSVYSRTRR